MLYVTDLISGVAELDNILYVVFQASSVIRMYTADTFSPLGDGIRVEGMMNAWDIVACRHDRQLYVADWKKCVWQVSVDDHSKYVKWLTTELIADEFTIWSLSLTSHGVLVTSVEPPVLHEYSRVDTELLGGVRLPQLLRAVRMPAYVQHLLHGVESSSGTFIVAHEGTSRDKKQDAVSEPFSVVSDL